jgi:hypothetical protein
LSERPNVRGLKVNAVPLCWSVLEVLRETLRIGFLESWNKQRKLKMIAPLIVRTFGG